MNSVDSGFRSFGVDNCFLLLVCKLEYIYHESTKLQKHEKEILISCFYHFVFSWFFLIFIKCKTAKINRIEFIGETSETN